MMIKLNRNSLLFSVILASSIAACGKDKKTSDNSAPTPTPNEQQQGGDATAQKPADQAAAPAPAPAPAPTPTPAPVPAPASIDPATVGTWNTGIEGLYSFDFTIAADGSAKHYAVVQGEVQVDMDSKNTTDTSVTPARMVMELTAIRAGEDASVGDKAYCIYDFPAANQMRHECSENDQFPNAFTEEAQIFTKK